jgi:AmpD protein
MTASASSAENDGWLPEARHIVSPNFDERPVANDICLVVIHAISLPPGLFGGQGIIDLFTNQLNPEDHPYYREIAHLRVSAHFLIRRSGELIQFVSLLKRAWHAGVSEWAGRERCNDFSIGIELEGCDDRSFEKIQYTTLNAVLADLQKHHSLQAVVAHSEIAPGRKTDPGPLFDWNSVIFPAALLR